MKTNTTLYLTLIILISQLLFNCSDNSNDSEPKPAVVVIIPEPDKEDEKKELLNQREKIEIKEVKQAISTQGFELLKGDFPKVNSEIKIKTPYEQIYAFKESGFNIIFETPENYKGVYFQFESRDSDEEYFFIDKEISTLDEEFNNETIAFAKQYNAPQILEKEKGQTLLKIPFKKELPLGTFQIKLATLLDNGQISEPIILTVNIDKTGGQKFLLGTWIAKNRAYFNTENSIIEEQLAIWECDNSFTSDILNPNCNDFERGEQLSCERIDAEISFFEDGTYSKNWAVTENIDKNTIKDTNCNFENLRTAEIVFFDKGNWVLDNLNNRLTLEQKLTQATIVVNGIILGNKKSEIIRYYNFLLQKDTDTKISLNVPSIGGGNQDVFYNKK